MDELSDNAITPLRLAIVASVCRRASSAVVVRATSGNLEVVSTQVGAKVTILPDEDFVFGDEGKALRWGKRQMAKLTGDVYRPADHAALNIRMAIAVEALFEGQLDHLEIFYGNNFALQANRELLALIRRHPTNGLQKVQHSISLNDFLENSNPEANFEG